MRYLKGLEEKEALKYLDLAAGIALQSPCFRQRCGSVIVNGQEIIGEGYNSPPLDERLTHCLKDDLPANFKSDKTCCIHAEQRAIIDALKNCPEKVCGSRIYFARLDKKDDHQVPAGKPFCTICSKMTLDVGIAEFVLWHQEGICLYGTEEYNRISFKFRK